MLWPHSGPYNLGSIALPIAIEHRRQDEGGDDDRIEPGNTAETVFLESAFPRVAHPGDDKTGQHKEHENSGSPTVEPPE